jgi:hypothetical protein
LQQSERRCDRLLYEEDIFVCQDLIPWILNHIDRFVSQSRGNESVHTVYLFPHAFKGHDDEVWDKVGQAVGSLQALRRLYICNHNSIDDDEVVPILNWERVARILSHVRQRIKISVISDASAWHAEYSRSLARAIHGYPTITCFEDANGKLPYESLDPLYSLLLATLPALESKWKLLQYCLQLTESINQKEE